MNSCTSKGCSLTWKEVGACTAASIAALSFVGGINKTFEKVALQKIDILCCRAFSQLPCAEKLTSFSPFAVNVTQLCSSDLANCLLSVTTKEIVLYSVAGGITLLLCACVCLTPKKRENYEEIVQ